MRNKAITGTPAEWKIYPDGSHGFALGAPDGQPLRTDDEVEVLLGKRWIVGTVELPRHAGAQFIARADQTVCGLCPGMKVRVPVLRAPSRRGKGLPDASK